ncbi:MAG: ribose 5-phosphate isomerase B [Desulfobacteraceae bacterium 4572_130]|nr:MAG: ribose 5-phosphate isomerase B [Desulfobacteraceae bacterium 4572_130]
MNKDKERKIVIGSDHAAFDLKEKVKKFVLELNYKINDIGTFTKESINYVDFGKKVAQAVSKKEYPMGILLCGTGIGMSITANRFSGVRAALCSDIFSVKMSRKHNDSNILVLGGRVVGDILAFELIKVWLETPFDGGRHLKRIMKIDDSIKVFSQG